MWTEYCLKRGIPIRQTGKIVTCKSQSEQITMYELYEQGMKNKIDLKLITMAEARVMEPTLVGYGNECIYSSTTSVMDTKQAMESLKSDLKVQGVLIEHGA